MDLQEVNEKLKKAGFGSLGNGFIRIPRGIFEKSFSHNPAERMFYKTYVTLLVLANHSDGTVTYKKTKHKLQKGETIISLRELARWIEIHPEQMKRMLEQLQKHEMILFEECKGGYLIRVLHYEEITGSYLTQKGVRHHNRRQPAGDPLDQLSPTGSGRTLRQEQEELEERKRLLKNKFE